MKIALIVLGLFCGGLGLFAPTETLGAILSGALIISGAIFFSTGCILAALASIAARLPGPAPKPAPREPDFSSLERSAK
jgi:hypothetical protein